MRKVLPILLSLLLTVVSFQNSTHEHEDHQVHLDCALCILQNSPQEVKDTKLEYKCIYITVVYIEKGKEKANPKVTYSPKASARSPPIV